MTTLYWLKLYYEILDDPKVMLLAPDLRWRFVECLLVAGRHAEDGLLPDIDTISFWVRSEPGKLLEDYQILDDRGLLEIDEETRHYRVSKFKDRQATLSKAEYMRRKRDRDRGGSVTPSGNGRYSSVTNGNTEERRGEKKRRERRIDPYPEETEAAAEFFFSLFPGIPTPIDAHLFSGALQGAKQYGPYRFSFMADEYYEEGDTPASLYRKIDSNEWRWTRSSINKALARADGEYY